MVLIVKQIATGRENAGKMMYLTD